MSEDACDIAVIGGGPGGSTTAMYLRRHGYRVVLLDKEKFPRFHIGESLLPFNLEIFDEIGVHDDLRAAGFVEKHAAEFSSSDGAIDETFRFQEGLVPGHPMAYQVLRSEFDHILLTRAAAMGADVREASVVTGCEIGAGGCQLRVEPREGSPYALDAKLVVDASGQHTFLSSRLNLKSVYADHRKFAVFAHFKKVGRAPGREGGNIIIFSLEDGGWFWFIPLAGDVTSLGLVLSYDIIKAQSGRIEAYFEERIRSTPSLAARMTEAERASPVRTINNFSYTSSRFAGDRFVLVGDAAAFLDPIFSSGVYMAMTSGKMAAGAIHQALQRNDLRARRFRSYERAQRAQLRVYFRLIRAYYRPEVRALLLCPSNRWRLQDAVVSVLAGCTQQGLALKLRVNLFYFIGWLQRFVPLSQRLYRGAVWN